MTYKNKLLRRMKLFIYDSQNDGHKHKIFLGSGLSMYISDSTTYVQFLCKKKSVHMGGMCAVKQKHSGPLI